MIWRFGHGKGAGKIRRNRAKCKLCGEVLESADAKPEKDVRCSCGNLAIQGGRRWLGRSCRQGVWPYEEMAEYETETVRK